MGSNVTAWLSSYLTGRKAQVSIRNALSEPFDIPSGVPQGSHLGPLLFLIFINDIGNSLKSPYLMFADDLKIFRSIRTANDEEQLQADLAKLKDWCIENDMSLNLNKCKTISFSRSALPTIPQYSINGLQLEEVHCIRDLGVIFDSRLSFLQHYDFIVSKANKMMGFIHRNCRDFTSIRALCNLYFALVRPHLESCCLVWAPFYDIHIKRMEAVQRRFVKMIRYRLCLQNNCLEDTNVTVYLNLMSLQGRREFLILTFFFKLINGFINSPELISLINLNISLYGIRVHRLLSVDFSRTSYQMNSPLNRLTRLVNKYYPVIDFFTTICSFKSSLKDHIMCREIELL